MSDGEQLDKELGYYKRRVDELAGENLRFDYTISGLRHELRQKRQGFALLSGLQQSIGAAPESGPIFEIVIEAINATLGMDRTVVLTPDGPDHYRPAHWLGFREEAAPRLAELSLELPEAFARGTGLLVVNKGTERDTLIERISEAFDLPFFICVPVMGEDAPIGLLLSGRLKEARPLYPPLDRGDIDTFQAIAGLVSAVVSTMRVAMLEKMDRLKTEFFANISHEFRTPITLTVGPLEQLLGGRYGEVAEPAREQLDMMRRNQERLLGLVNQILDLAKMEGGGMELRASAAPDINGFVEERVTRFRPAAERQGLELRERLDPGAAHADLYVDREKLDKLLQNLLSNALKFTKEGWIEVSTQVGEGEFRLTVTDTGLGIKPDELPHVFDRFRQAEGSASRESAGTGIGLALVREIARLHGGGVDVSSEYGRGTSFTVTLPLGRDHLSPSSIVEATDAELGDVPMVPGAAVPAPGGDGGEVERLNAETEEAFEPERPTVLYAEDNADLRRHVRDLMADQCNLFLAVDGRDGLEKVRQLRPDLVLTDQMMPNMDGRDLLRAIRDDPDLRFTPVIFLTARVGTEARVSGLEAGADDYLTKPFHEGELVARVRNLVRSRRQERELAELNRRLESRVEEQMAELLRSGELKRFLPPAVAESVLSGQLAGDEEGFQRRKITVLALELNGFADLAEGLEPEELSAIVNDYLRELTAAAIGNGGTVEAAGGQQIQALFGAPAPMELSDQARAAARTALDMHERLEQLVSEWRRRGVAGALGLSAGINTGFCTVGVYGSELMRSYAAVGVPVNVATLLAAGAGPGETLCTLPTRALLDEELRTRDRGAMELRGVARPVEVFEILPAPPEEDASSRGPAPVFLPK